MVFDTNYGQPGSRKFSKSRHTSFIGLVMLPNGGKKKIDFNQCKVEDMYARGLPQLGS